MPNQRSPGQKLIAFPLDNELATAMDEARGSMNRSQFIREALAEKLKKPLALTVAPDRVKVKAPKIRETVSYDKRKKKGNETKGN